MLFHPDQIHFKASEILPQLSASQKRPAPCRRWNIQWKMRERCGGIQAFPSAMLPEMIFMHDFVNGLTLYAGEYQSLSSVFCPRRIKTNVRVSTFEKFF
jgi:hypothetical protein